jgi:GDPmannose 4,6-dehydratase
MAAHWIVRNYRESYGLFACCGILFNHESPRRGIEFVTQKIAKGARDVMIGKTDVIRLGNLDSKRDWGHAEDYVEAMWLMMQHDTDGEYVVSTGKQRSVREFVELVFANYGVRIGWVGSGTDEVGVDIKTDRVLIKVDPAFYRPCEVETLVGDPEKIRSIGWEPKHTFGDLVRSMVGNDANTVRKLYA